MAKIYLIFCGAPRLRSHWKSLAYDAPRRSPNFLESWKLERGSFPSQTFPLNSASRSRKRPLFLRRLVRSLVGVFSHFFSQFKRWSINLWPL